MKTYDYQPGNGTRYFLAYGPLEGGGSLLVWLRRGDVGGVAFHMPSHFGTLFQDYFAEKTGLTDHPADTAALLGFLEQQGHSVRILSNHDSRGRWIANDLAFTGGAADV